MAEMAELTYTVGGDGVAEGDLPGFGITLTTEATKDSAVKTYSIAVGYTPNNNYLISTVDGTYSITEATLDITASGYEKTYDGTAGTISLNVAQTDATVYYSTSKELTAENYKEGSTVKPSFTDAGTYTVYYYVVRENYSGLAGQKQIVIQKATPTIKAENVSTVYDGTFHGITAVSNGGAGVLYSTDGVNFSTNCSLKSSGTYTVTIRIPGSANYNTVEKKVTLSIAPRELVLTAGSDEKDYDGEALTNEDYSIGGDGLANGDRIVAVQVSGSLTEAGQTDNRISSVKIVDKDGNDVTGNYQVVYLSGKLTVNKAPETGDVAATDNGKTTGTHVCYWHFFILLLLAVNLILAFAAKEDFRKEYTWPILILTISLFILFAILGSCRYDWPCAGISAALAAVCACFRYPRRKENQE